MAGQSADIAMRRAALQTQAGGSQRALDAQQARLNQQLAARSGEIKAAADKANTAMDKLIDETLAKGVARQTGKG